MFQLDNFFFNNFDLRNKEITYPNFYQKIIFIFEILFYHFRENGFNKKSFIITVKILRNLTLLLNKKSFDNILENIIIENNHLNFSIFFKNYLNS